MLDESAVSAKKKKKEKGETTGKKKKRNSKIKTMKGDNHSTRKGVEKRSGEMEIVEILGAAEAQSTVFFFGGGN